MTGPDYSHGYLRVPLALWTALFCRAPLTRRQLQLVAVILRESWGWQNRNGEPGLWTRPLSTRQFSRRTGLSTDRIHQDLVRLLQRGLLREAGGRYHLVADPTLWITAQRPMPASSKRRSTAPKSSAPTAEIALVTPGPKKGLIEKREIDRPGFSGRELSPPVDNQAGGRLAAIIAFFAGPLNWKQQDTLNSWIHVAGVAGVWSNLEPALRQSPAAVLRLLDQRQNLGATSSGGKEQDA